MAEQTQTDFFSGFESVDSTTPISNSTIKSIHTKTLEDENHSNTDHNPHHHWL